MPSDDEPRPAPGRMFTASRPPEVALGQGPPAPSAADPWELPEQPEQPLDREPGSGGPIGAAAGQPVADDDGGDARDMQRRAPTTATETEPAPAAPADPLFAGVYDASDDDPSHDAALEREAPGDVADEEALHQAADEVATAADLDADPTPTASQPTDASDALWGTVDGPPAEDQPGVVSVRDPGDDPLVLPEWQVPWTLDEDMSGLTAQLERLVQDEPEQDRAPAARAEPHPQPQPLEQPARQPTLRPALTGQPAVAPPAPPATRVHERRIDQRPGPIRMTPSEALALVREGPGALRRGPIAR